MCQRYAYIWNHPSHYPVYPPIPPWSHKGHNHGHEWSTLSMSIGPEIRLFQILTLKNQGQGHMCGQRERSHSWPSIQLICFLFVSHQSNQQFLTWSYSKIWPWKIHGHGHGWGQSARSQSWSSIQPMHFLFCFTEQPLLRYGKSSV